MNSSGGEGITVLLVDDETSFLEVAAHRLEEYGDRLDVLAESSASAALDLLQNDTTIDCIVSDYQMPGMDGLEFLETIREDHSPSLPFILFTGKGREEVAMKALNLGADRYFQKKGKPKAQFGVLAQAIEQEVKHVRVERRAERHEHRYRRVFRNLHEGLAIHRLCWDENNVPIDYEILETNPQYEVILDIDASEAERSLASELYESDHPPALERYATVVERGEPINFEIDYGPIDRHFRVAAFPMNGDRFATAFSDVTAERRREQTLRDLHDVNTDLETADTVDSVCRQTVQAADSVLDFDQSLVWIANEDHLEVTATTTDAVPETQTRIPIDEGIVGTTYRTGESLMVDDRPDHDKSIPETSYRSLICIPLGNWGVLQAISKTRSAFDDTDLELAKLLGGTATSSLERLQFERTLRRRQALVENTSDLLTILSPGGDIEYCNPAVSAVLGYDPERLIGSNAFDLIHPDDVASLRTMLEEIIERPGETGAAEIRFQAEDEEWVWTETTAKNRLEDPHIEGLLLSSREIGARKRREKRQQQYKKAVEGSFDLISAIDTDLEYLFGNEPYREYHGIGEEPIRGKSVEEVLDERVYEQIEPRLEEGLAGEFSQWEMTREHPERGERHLSIQYYPLEDDSGTVEAGVSIMRDITERKVRENSLKTMHEATAHLEGAETQREVYDILVDVAEDILDFDLVAVDVVEDDSLVQQACTSDVESHGYFHEIGLDEESLATRAFRRNETIVVDDVSEDDISPADNDYESSLTVPIGDYGTFQAVSETVGAFDETDRELAELLVDHAQVRLKTLEDERALREQREQLRRKNERLDKFASVVSHDLRNPLTVADGNLKLAMEECDSELLEDIAWAHERIDTIIEDVLTMAREGTVVDESERESVDIEEVATDCWESVATAEASLQFETSGRVKADLNRFRRVFENFFRNAIEHGGDGVTVTVGRIDDEGFYVADDGPGIPPEDRESVFGPGETSSENGNGFGLSIVKSIVDAHDWSVEIAESESGGARIEIKDVESLQS